MKSVFQASTGIEAHMIKNLLHLNDVESEVFGEHLQGGIGDLQATGVVRVMVADDDYAQAHAIISEWEASQPEPELDSSYNDNKRGSFGSALIGFIVGVMTILLITQTNVTHDGIDYNGDGKRDVKWLYVNNVLRSIEVDRNRDSEIDEVSQYDLSGNPKSLELDNNFDGHYEVECRYRAGNLTSCRSDADNDGFAEVRESYLHGILTTISMFDSVSRKLKKKQYFESQQLKRAEIDLDGDGVLETLYKYDEFEELFQ